MVWTVACPAAVICDAQGEEGDGRTTSMMVNKESLRSIARRLGTTIVSQAKKESEDEDQGEVLY